MHDDDIDRSNPWHTRGSRRVYDNAWIRVREDDVINPAGHDGIYGVIEFKHRAVGVVPIDAENQTWLVGQYRYPLGSYEWEIPEGGCPQGEDPMQTAARELREETGLLAERFTLLFGGLQLSNSVSNERGWLYVAEGLRETTPDPEDTERLAVMRLPLAEAVAMAEQGRIRDLMSVVALLSLKDRVGGR